MPVQVCFSLKLLRALRVADHGCARVRVFTLWVVCLHVRFPVVASLEEFAADTALMGCFLGGGSLALLLDTIDTGQDGRCVKFRSSGFAHYAHIVAVGWGVRLRPRTRLILKKVV